jgi:glycosyltransferase involved in cell wall biosynthesis
MSVFNGDPLVSVIIPNYNHGAFLHQRLDSVLNQTYPCFEVIILDDCSIDSSRDIIEEYRSSDKVSQIVYNEKNSGSPFVQWQKGILLARGQYVWIAETDDFCDYRFLEICMNRFKDYKDVVLTYTDSCIVDEFGSIVHKNLNWWLDDVDEKKWHADYYNNGVREIQQALSVKNTIPNASSVVFKKQFYEETAHFKYAGDWYFWIRVLQKGNIVFIKESLNYFRSHSQTTRHYASIDKKRTFLKEKIKTIQYLRHHQLLSGQQWGTHKSAIFSDWITLFRISHIFSKDYFIPFNRVDLLLYFLYYKVFNKLKLPLL